MRQQEEKEDGQGEQKKEGRRCETDKVLLFCLNVHSKLYLSAVLMEEIITNSGPIVSHVMCII